MLNQSQLTIEFDHFGLSLGVRRLVIIKAVASIISVLLNFCGVSNGCVRLELGHNHCYQKGDTGPNGGALASCP